MSSPLKILSGRTVSGPVSARIRIDGREYINFFGAGYLALSSVPEIRRAAAEVLDQGEPFARQLPAAHGARDAIFDAVERAGALACGTETCVYFASGYFIGMVGLAMLEPGVDQLFLDESAHHSLRDAARMSGRPTFTFAHCDVDSLHDVLKQRVQAKQRPLLLTDGVFATTGRVPPLGEYAKLLAPYAGYMLVDESHAFGIVGKDGRGAAKHCGAGHMALTGATMSKAYCAQGGLVGCSAANAAKARGRPPLNAAMSGSPLTAAVAAASLNYVAERPQLRHELRALGDDLRARVRQLGLEVIDTPAPIVSFKYGNRAAMLALQRRAFEQGIYLHYSTYVGAGEEGIIRCAAFRDHSVSDFEALIEVLR